ncbi:MAG: hypothetical protein ACT4P1_18275 [Sporichthyaceae bacterium]
MPTRLLREGRNLVALLAAVRAEYGADVRIVTADRELRGGVGGFFAREYFVLTLDLDEVAALPAQRAGATSLLDLVNTVQDTAAPPPRGRHRRPEASSAQ